MEIYFNDFAAKIWNYFACCKL